MITAAPIAKEPARRPTSSAVAGIRRARPPRPFDSNCSVRKLRAERSGPQFISTDFFFEFRPPGVEFVYCGVGIFEFREGTLQQPPVCQH